MLNGSGRGNTEGQKEDTQKPNTDKNLTFTNRQKALLSIHNKIRKYRNQSNRAAN